MDGLEELLLTLFGVFMVVILFIVVIAIVEYVLKGIALSRMARNAGMPNPGLAWVPFANNYLLGLLCERSGICRTGRAWKFSVLLPVLDLLCFFGGSTSLAFIGTLADSVYYDWDSPALWENFFSGISSLFGLAFTVVMAFALYNLYCDYTPGREALFTALSVIFGSLAQSIILFINRDRVPVSAQMGGGYGYPPQGGTPYPGGPYGPQWGQPPQQSGPYTTQWNQPPQQGGSYGPQWSQQPQQGGPYGTQWNQQPQQGGPYTTQWSQQPPSPPPPQDQPPIPQDPPSYQDGPEIK